MPYLNYLLSRLKVLLQDGNFVFISSEGIDSKEISLLGAQTLNLPISFGQLLSTALSNYREFQKWCLNVYDIMSRQGPNFPGHRDRREGRQYGTGAWYGASDYYVGTSNSNEAGLPPKRPRYSDSRYRDRIEMSGDGMQFIKQDGGDYGMYTDFTSAGDSNQQVIMDPSTGRNFGGRRLSGDYHQAVHRIPKNFWSSEHIAYQSAYNAPTSNQMRQQSGYVHEPLIGSRGDSKYPWRTHPYSARAPDVRSRPAPLYSEPDPFDAVRQRSSWFRSDESRSNSGRDRSAQLNKPSVKFSTHREAQMPVFGWHGRKYSDSELGSCEPELVEKNDNEKDPHISKKQALHRPENKPQEFPQVDSGRRHHRSEETREKRFSDEVSPYSSGQPREVLNESNAVTGYYGEATRLHGAEKRGSDLSSHPDSRIVHEEEPGKVHTEKVPAEEITENRGSPVSCEGYEQQLQPRFENVSPVLSQNDVAHQPSGEEVNVDSADAAAPASLGEQMDLEDGCECGKIAQATEPKEEELIPCEERTQVPVDHGFQQPQTEEAVISKLDSMDKEIVECEEDIQNLGQIEFQLEKELMDLKKEIEDAENEKQQQSDPMTADARDEKDPKDELMDYFIDKFRPKDFELVVKIYNENQIKAKLSHAQLWPSNFVAKPSVKPLYYQPSDLPFYFDNIRRHKRFRMRLVKFLQMKKIAQNKKKDVMKQLYEKQKEGWLKKLERIENNIRRKAKLSKVRAFYEREFPEIKKQREQQERMTRFGARTTWGPLARSEAEFEEIVGSLSELEATEKQMHQLAVEPPQLLDRYERRIQYSNKNGLIVDLEAFERERKYKNIWCEEEKAIFKERFTLYPKDFEKIAAGLKRKTISECVLYYYRNKKKENFKATSKKPGKKTGRLQRQLVSTLTYAQPLLNIQDLQHPQPVKTRQKERERERERQKELEQHRDPSVERPRSLRSDHEATTRIETRTTRELRSSDEKATEQSDVSLPNGVGGGSKLVTQQMETQCKQTVDDLIARYLAKKPLPAENVDPSRWSELEISKAIEGLKHHGRNWPAISRMVHTKSEAQCKNFYFNYKRKFHLESILGISKQPVTSFQRDGPPSTTEDETLNRKKRSKRILQQENESSTDVCTQSIDQDTQERPVDVEEVEDEKGMRHVEEANIVAEQDQLPANSTQTVGQKVVEALDAKEDEDADTHEATYTPAVVEGLDSTEGGLSDRTFAICHTSNVESHVDEPVSIRDGELVPGSSGVTTFVQDIPVITTSETRSAEQEQQTRPESLNVNDGTAQPTTKATIATVPVRAQPPPLTPVIVSRVSEHAQDSGKLGSPSSVLKGISLQGEIGAFRETLERTLEKKNELNRSEAAVSVSFRGEIGESQKQSHLTTYAQQQQQRESMPTQQNVRQTKEHVETYPFAPIPSSMHPSLEQSAAIQVFAGRQASLMSLHQSQAKQYGHLSQEAATIQRHYQHSHMNTAHEHSLSRKSPSLVAQIAHSHRSSPNTSMPIVVESKENKPFVSSLPSRFLYPTAPIYSGVQNIEKMKHTEERQHSDVSEYPNISLQGVQLNSATNPNKALMRHGDPYESYHPIASQTVDRTFPFFEPHFPMSAGDARVRAYEELLERSASIPSLRHPPVEVPKSAKSLPRDSASHGSPTPGDNAPLPVEQRQYHLYYGAAANSRERTETRKLDKRDQVVADQSKSHCFPYKNLRQARQEARPTLDRQLLQGIGGRKVPGSIYHHPSGLLPDESVRPRIPEHVIPIDKYRKPHMVFEPLRTADHRVIMERPHLQAMIEARMNYGSMPASMGLSIVTSTDHHANIPSNNPTPESHYGISTGLAHKTPTHMSIMRGTAYCDELRTHNKDMPQSKESIHVANVKHEELEHLNERGVISTKRTSAIKSQSKNTRPSSVDSVIHKSFLTERQQQLSSSLGDLRNLTALHLSPNLPISPISASFASKRAFMFRPWEKEADEDSAVIKSTADSSAATVASHADRERLLKVSQGQTTDSTKRPSLDSENSYDEPLMSPTIPYTDKGKEATLKDIQTSTEQSSLYRASKSSETSIPSTEVIGKVVDVQRSVNISMPLVEKSLSGGQPKSPTDSEATLSADEPEMEMMSDGLNKLQRHTKWDELYHHNTALELGFSHTSNSKSMNQLCKSQPAFQGEEQKPNSGRAMAYKSDAKIFNKLPPFLKTNEQSNSLADLSIQKTTDQQGSKLKGKSKKKQKSGAKPKRKSPKRNDKTITDEILTVDNLQLPHAKSTLSAATETISSRFASSAPPSNERHSPCAKPYSTAGPANSGELEPARASGLLAGSEGKPFQNSTRLDKISKVNRYDEATPLTAKDAPFTKPEIKMIELGGTEGEEHFDESDSLHETQNIVDVEETSAAISSIQKDVGESPSAEEDTAEPYLALWPPADGYPCGVQPVPNTNEEVYQTEYNSEPQVDNVVTDEKEVSTSFGTHFMKVPHSTSTERDSANIAMELQTRLTMDIDLNFQQANSITAPTQSDNGIFNFETTPISPPGSPISPAEVPTSQGEILSSDGAFSHSVLSLNIAVTSQDSSRPPANAVAFPYSTLSFPYSTLSSVPASRPGSLHGSGSSSTCHSPNPLGNIQNSPCYSAPFSNAMSRSDIQDGQNNDHLRNLTERLLNNDMCMSQDDHMTLDLTDRTADPVQAFSSTITYEPLSDED